MEERTLDKDNGRTVKLKRTREGAIDAVEEGEETEAELSLDFGEFDEDLAGLSPEETEAALKKREKAKEAARAEGAKLVEEGERLLRSKCYPEAEPYFSQAVLYDPDLARAREAVWICRTENYTNTEVFYRPKAAMEFAETDEKTKAAVFAKLAEKLKREQAEYETEKKAIEEGVLAAQSTRRKAFRKNRNYYLVRFSIVICFFALFLCAALVSVYFITRSRSNLPIVLAGSFGGAALISLLVLVLFARGLYGAQRLCRENEKLSSTEDGARLETLRERLDCLDLVFGVKAEQEG